jgi:hypothetical protein
MTTTNILLLRPRITGAWHLRPLYNSMARCMNTGIAWYYRHWDSEKVLPQHATQTKRGSRGTALVFLQPRRQMGRRRGECSTPSPGRFNPRKEPRYLLKMRLGWSLSLSLGVYFNLASNPEPSRLRLHYHGHHYRHILASTTPFVSSCLSLSLSSFNLLKPTGHVMRQQFNIQQLYALSTLYLCVLYLSENKQWLVPLTA